MKTVLYTIENTMKKSEQIMKRTVWINKISLACLLFLIIMGTSLFFMSNALVFSAPGDNPTIAISSPAANTWIKSGSVVISGTYGDDNVAASSDLVFTAYEQKDGGSTPGDEISNSTQNSADWNISSLDSDNQGTWKFTKQLSEGKHNIVIVVSEIASPTFTNQASISLTFGNRPFVASEKIVLSDNTEYNAEDFTGVPNDARIKITLMDNKPMENLVGKIQSVDNPYSPIKVLLDNNQISGKATIDETVQSGNYIYTILFTPITPFVLNKNYLVYVDPSIIDDSGNQIFSRFFKFTTQGDMAPEDNPHGSYPMNTNMCALCHDSHSGTTENLDGGTNKDTFNSQLKDPSTNYCLACHDGTLNAPKVYNADSANRHTSTADLSQAESCTSCHNPHKGWSPDNPNMLKDHYVYTHNETDPAQGLVTATVDSLDTSCDTCHDDQEIVTQSNVKYSILSYANSSTAIGKIDKTNHTVQDYSLCLRCHNANNNAKNPSIANIDQYYTDSTSGHYLPLPSGQSTQDDGSPLNGQMPCSTCHETHGSDNIANLKEQLGNNQVSGAQLFKTTGTTWTADNERKFCLSCHNNTTEIYGKLVVFPKTNSRGGAIVGHQDSNTQGCSTCHGSGSTDSEKALSAAHSPQ